MAKLTAKRRNHLNSSEFGLPGVRKYPMPDKAHAANAKARAAQQANKGNLSQGNLMQIVAQANKVLAKDDASGYKLNPPGTLGKAPKP